MKEKEWYPLALKLRDRCILLPKVHTHTVLVTPQEE